MENRVAVNVGDSTSKSITPSGFFGNSIDMIVELENFMTEEEQEFLFNFASNNTTWDYTVSKKNENGTVIYDADIWADRVATLHTLQKVNQKVVDVVHELFDRLKISKHYLSIPLSIIFAPGTGAFTEIALLTTPLPLKATVKSKA